MKLGGAISHQTLCTRRKVDTSETSLCIADQGRKPKAKIGRDDRAVCRQTNETHKMYRIVAMEHESLVHDCGNLQSKRYRPFFTEPKRGIQDRSSRKKWSIIRQITFVWTGAPTCSGSLFSFASTFLATELQQAEEMNRAPHTAFRGHS